MLYKRSGSSLQHQASFSIYSKFSGEGQRQGEEGGGEGGGTGVCPPNPPPDAAYPPHLESKAVGWRQHVSLCLFQLVAQGGDTLLLQRSCSEELQSHVWFWVFFFLEKCVDEQLIVKPQLPGQD